jgi:cyclic pyranopterin phosphate synthase
MTTHDTFSHLDDDGHASMVNVGAKPVQRRRATAGATLVCQPETIAALKSRALPKGDVLTVAQIAGIQAAKQTPQWIPLCHSLGLDFVDVQFEVEPDRIRVICTAETCARTGVEMEALTGATAAALTLYDMCKAVDKTMQIQDVRVLEKIKI